MPSSQSLDRYAALRRLLTVITVLFQLSVQYSGRADFLSHCASLLRSSGSCTYRLQQTSKPLRKNFTAELPAIKLHK